MLTWHPIFYLIIVVLVLLYALFSIYLKKIAGLFIAATFHIVLGIFALPSIGWYIIILAVIEIIAGLIMLNKQKKSPSSK